MGFLAVNNFFFFLNTEQDKAESGPKHKEKNFVWCFSKNFFSNKCWNSFFKQKYLYFPLINVYSIYLPVFKSVFTVQDFTFS